MQKETITTPLSASLSLLGLRPGEEGIIERIGTERQEVRQRLLEMGFVPGTSVEAVRSAPLGDPLQFLVEKTNVTMRKSEARLVFVRRTRP